VAENTFVQSHLDTTGTPSLEGTPQSQLPRKQPVTWRYTLTPVPFREATDIFQDNKKHLGTLFNAAA